MCYFGRWGCLYLFVYYLYIICDVLALEDCSGTTGVDLAWMLALAVNLALAVDLAGWC